MRQGDPLCRSLPAVLRLLANSIAGGSVFERRQAFSSPPISRQADKSRIPRYLFWLNTAVTCPRRHTMTAILRVAILTAMAASCTPAVAAGRQSSADSLLRRIDSLERRAADLEQRVRELETLVKVEPSRDRPVSASANWRDLANWRRLRRGMNMDQVRALLGEPERVDAISIRTTWTWGRYPEYAEVHFDEGKLAGWSEPRR